MDAKQFIGQTVRGRLKRMRDGWGFVESDSFSGDLFIHARENPGIADLPVNTELFFTVSSDSKGKAMATNAAPADPNAVAGKEKLGIETGERFTGVVKNFEHHWGFVRTDAGKDYFFNERAIDTYGGELPPVGSVVSFTTAPDNQKPDKVMAVNLQVITPGNGVWNEPSRKRTAADAGMGGYAQAGMPMMPPAPAPSDQSSAMGMFGGITTVEQLEHALCTLPASRIFQIAEMKMRMEAASATGAMGGYM